MTKKNRGDILAPGDVVELKVLFKDDNNIPKDLDAFPQVQFVDPTSIIYKDFGSQGVYRINTGYYGYLFTVPLNGPVGVWIDNWQGIMDGYISVEGTFNFVVLNQNTDRPYDGYEQLGDIPNISLTPEAIHNINRLMHLLRIRLQSSGRHQIKDEYGNIVYENCDIFSVDELYSFLCSSLAEFNLTPHFTQFIWEDPMIVDNFADIIVEGAYIMALASKALIEKGREFNISDNGISFQPPATADLLNGQMGTLLGPYREKLKQIKYQFKPAPLGLGTLRITAVAPQYMRLRHRRAKQFI